MSDWTKLEEHRFYTGVTVEVVAARFREEIDEALAEGYVPDDLTWSGKDGLHVLDVTFIHDPKRAPRPI